MGKKQEKLIAKAFKKLLKKNGTVTSLEVKEYLRKNEPFIVWLQSNISTTLIAIESNSSDITFNDNGVYRTYMNVSSKPKAKKTKKVKKTKVKTSSSSISKTKAVKLIENSKGKFFTVEFVKKNGDSRVLNGQVRKDNLMNSLGYLNVKESNGNIRQVNPRTIVSLKIAGSEHTVK